MEIIDTILEWPIIIQGALGSALFWVILAVGQKLIEFSGSRLSKDKKVANYWPLTAYTSDDLEQKKRAYLNCIYGGLHYLVKALIVIILSLMISPIIHTVAIVGYLISVFYLFKSLSYIPHFDSFGSYEKAVEKRKELVKELMPETANKQKQPDA